MSPENVKTPSLTAPRKRAAGSPTLERHAKAVLHIQASPDADQKAYMARQLVLCTLPHSNPGDEEEHWIRRTGNSALVVQAGWDPDTNKSYGLPYGTIPRLLLFWISTEVQWRKNREDLTDREKRTLHLGKSLNDFMRAVGLNPDSGGGKRSDAKRLKEQAERLFYAHIDFQETVVNSALNVKGRRRFNMSVASDSSLLWSTKKPEQGSLWDSWVEIGEKFYMALVDRPVPVDVRALRSLRRPLELDMYAWVCLCVYPIVKHKRAPQFVTWSNLAEQLGADYADVRDLATKAKKVLRKVQRLYPGLTIGKARGGFTVHATRLAVPEKVIKGN